MDTMVHQVTTIQPKALHTPPSDKTPRGGRREEGGGGERRRGKEEGEGGGGKV